MNMQDDMHYSTQASMQRAETILAELLARPGALTRDDLRRKAADSLRGMEGVDGYMVAKQMIVLAARDDIEADELLERMDGFEPTKRPTKAELAALDPELKHAAYKAIEA